VKFGLPPLPSLSCLAAVKFGTGLPTTSIPKPRFAADKFGKGTRYYCQACLSEVSYRLVVVRIGKGLPPLD
jgi:hypothetical protein